jgi:hypothetical protein
MSYRSLSRFLRTESSICQTRAEQNRQASTVESIQVRTQLAIKRGCSKEEIGFEIPLHSRYRVEVNRRSSLPQGEAFFDIESFSNICGPRATFDAAISSKEQSMNIVSTLVK